MKRSTRSRVFGAFGALLISLGLILNQWTIASFMTPDGAIESPMLRGMIWFLDILCVLAGIFLANFRNRIALKVRLGVNITLLAVTLLGSLAAAEALLRLVGFRPWPEGVLNPAHIQVEPGGTLSRPDAVLGYTLKPGTYLVTLPNGYSFSVTHSETGTRITDPLGRNRALPPGSGIWIFGCSFTYGWGVSDQNTYAWKLQEIFPEDCVVNFGVSGYSTVQSFLQFRDALVDRQAPKIAVLAYASFHDARNTLSRSWTKSLSLYPELSQVKIPFAAVGEERCPAIEAKQVSFRQFPMSRYLVLANLMDELYNRIEVRQNHSHRRSFEVILAVRDLARNHGVDLLLAGITNDPATTAMLVECAREGIATANISVDLSILENTNQPFDSHPSPLAHRRYADRLGDVLEPLIMHGSSDSSTARKHSKSL